MIRTLLFSVIVVCGISLIPGIGNAQTGVSDADAPVFACPLRDAKAHVDSAALRLFGSQDLKLIISSQTDSVVKSTADAVITAVQKEADGSYEIVFNFEDFWFWLSGIEQPLVRPQQRIKKGEPIGKLHPGAKLEILLFDFETPADPLEYLPCFPKAPSN
jgi:hypothetical protein